MQTNNRVKVLSKRENQVLHLIAEEMTTSEIADTLNISFGTVETHRKNIREKLNARNIAGIMIKAIKIGELRVEDVSIKKHPNSGI